METQVKKEIVYIYIKTDRRSQVFASNPDKAQGEAMIETDRLKEGIKEHVETITIDNEG